MAGEPERDDARPTDVTLNAIVSVRVPMPEDGPALGPSEAFDEAARIAARALHQRLSDTRAADGIEWSNYGDDIVAGLVDYPGREEWVTGGTASSYLEDPVSEALYGALASGTVALEYLKTVSRSGDAYLSQAADVGLVVHPDTAPERRTAALRALIGRNPYLVLSILEERPEVGERLTRESIAPLFQSDSQEVRARALTALRTQRPGNEEHAPSGDDTPVRGRSR